MNLYDLTIHEAASLLRKKKISSVELTKAVLDRIKKVDGEISAFLAKTPELALAQAKLIDKKIARGEVQSRLAGIPVAIKDNIATLGIKTTCASRILEDYIPPFNATVVDKLKNAGAVIIGKTNLDEFGHGSSTEYSAFGPTHNPWDKTRVPGGSSGGSAAAVASGECLFALGTDTGGSIRQPAGFCAVSGLRPTYGLLSRYGLIAMTSSMDVIGPMTKDVKDLALILQILAGKDELDSTTVAKSVPNYSHFLKEDIKGLRVGVPKEFFIEGMDWQVERSIKEAIEKLASLGASVKEITLPHTKYGVACYYIITPSEISSNLSRFDGIKYGKSSQANNLFGVYTKTRGEGFGQEVKRRIMLGTYTLSAGYYEAYYLKAQKVRTVIKNEVLRALEEVDVIVAPTSPNIAFKIGTQVDDPLKMYLEDIFMDTASLAGLPAVSIPCGFAEGLPVGLQIMGKPFDEGMVLRVANAYQENTKWHKKRPEL